jgi:flagellar P-ring protein precursor FlgI
MVRLVHLLNTIFILTILLFHEPLSYGVNVRIKDLVDVKGVRNNYLSGFGLVVGLRSTGDSKKSIATQKAFSNMLTRMGMKTTVEDVVPGSMAVVLVTSELPPFAKIGDRIDVKVSVMGDAKSLAGGTLVLTPLKASDGEIYALAQGPIVVGQAGGSGPQVLTVARSPLGATIEREFSPVIDYQRNLTFVLKNPDFTTCSRIVQAINKHLNGFYASTIDHGSLLVKIPDFFGDRTVEFMAEIENLAVDSDSKSIIVLNERTGTVVMGSNVVISPVSIAHGDLTIRVGGKPSGKGVVNLPSATVGELIETLNSIGVKPADLIGIIQSLHAAGAINAEIKFL